MLELTDAAKPVEVAAVTKAVSGIQAVRAVRDVRSRRMGHYTLADLTISVDPYMSVSAAQQVATSVRALINEKFPRITEVLVNVLPEEEPHEHAHAETGAHEHTHATNATHTHVAAKETSARASSHAHTHNHEQEHTHEQGHEHTHEHVSAGKNAHTSPSPAPMQSSQVLEEETRKALGFLAGVSGVTRVTPHYLAGKTSVHVSVQVSPSLTISDARALTARAQQVVRETLRVQSVEVHLDLST